MLLFCAFPFLSSVWLWSRTKPEQLLFTNRHFGFFRCSIFPFAMFVYTIRRRFISSNRELGCPYLYALRHVFFYWLSYLICLLKVSISFGLFIWSPKTRHCLQIPFPYICRPHFLLFNSMSVKIYSKFNLMNIFRVCHYSLIKYSVLKVSGILWTSDTTVLSRTYRIFNFFNFKNVYLATGWNSFGNYRKDSSILTFNICDQRRIDNFQFWIYNGQDFNQTQQFLF